MAVRSLRRHGEADRRHVPEDGVARHVLDGAAQHQQHRVGVRIDEARQDRLATAVDDLQIGMVTSEFGARADGGDAAVPDGDGAVFNGAEGVVHGDDGGAGDESVG